MREPHENDQNHRIESGILWDPHKRKEGVDQLLLALSERWRSTGYWPEVKLLLDDYAFRIGPHFEAFIAAVSPRA